MFTKHVNNIEKKTQFTVCCRCMVQLIVLIVVLIIVLIIALLTVDPEFDHIWKYVPVHGLVQGSQGVVAQVQCQIGNNS